jgi:O-antigen/teichoic acid export membrane protein
MNFRRWVVFSFAMHVVVIVLDKGAGLVLTLLLADNPDYKGVADLLTNLPFILMAVANLGLATSLVYFIRRERTDVQKVAETTSLVAVVWGSLVGLLGMGMMLIVVPWLKPEWSVRPSLVIPVCACVPFLLLTSYFNSIQLATERVRDYNLVHVLSSAAFLPLFLLFFWLGGGGPAAAEGVVLGRLSVSVLMTVVVLWLLRGVVRLRPRLHVDFLRKGVAFGWKANVTSVLTYLNHRLDLLILPLLFVPVVLEGRDPVEAVKDEVAFYSLAVTLAELIWHFPEALRDLFFSKVAGETHERARQVTPVLSRLCLAVAVIGVVVVAVLFWPLFAVLGGIRGLFGGDPDVFHAEWLPTVWPAFLWLAPGTAAFTVAKILQNDLAARGHLNACMASGLISFVGMVVLDVLWVPTGGAIGAAKASSVAYLLAAAYTLWIYPRSGGASALECVVPRRGDLAHVREIAASVWRKIRRKR